MSVSTETETSENAQQNEEQEAAAQTEEQGTVEQVTERLVTNDVSNNQESKFDFEKSKGNLEYISILLALFSVVATGMIKVLSIGSHLRFSFNINYFEFNLTNNDLINFFLSMFFCFFAIVFCQKTIKIKNKINTKININCEGKFRIRKLLRTILWIILYCLLICSYLFLGEFIIDLLCSAKDVTFFKYMLKSTYSISFILVLLFFIITISGEKITKTVFAILGLAAFLLVSSNIIESNYQRAVNQREFEIIELENNESQSQKYVVISKGSSYSAYQCSIEEQEAGKVLIIHTDLHRFFPLDDTETKLNNFDEYQLYKYGKPIDADEESSTDEYQSNEE